MIKTLKQPGKLCPHCNRLEMIETFSGTESVKKCRHCGYSPSRHRIAATPGGY